MNKGIPESATANSVYFSSELLFPTTEIFEHLFNENMSILTKNLILNFFRVISFDKLEQF